MARIHGSRNERVEIGVGSLTITPRGSLPKLFLPIFTNCVCWPRDISSKWRNSLINGLLNVNDLLNWKLRLPPGHFALLMPLNEQTKKGLTVVAGVIKPNCQQEIELLLYIRDKGDYIWNTGDLLGHILVLPCPVIEVNGKL